MFGKTSKGMTLLEVMVAVALLTVTITVAVICLTTGLKRYRSSTDLSFSLRSNYTGLEWITNELRFAERFYSPSDSDFGVISTAGAAVTNPSFLLVSGGPALVFKKVDSSAPSDYRVIGYRLYMDAQKKVIQRMVYEDNYPATLIPREIRDIARIDPKEKFNYAEVKFEFDDDEPADSYPYYKKNLNIFIMLSWYRPDGTITDVPMETEVRTRR